ncbi:MAG: hypothetical protein JXB07_13900 [Anaerolineae bacterium]|nr:hypothetical protein [Anaerolineae bacterium]
MKTSDILRIGAIGSAIATLTFVAIALLLWPFGWAVPGNDLLSGQPHLYSGSPDILRIYFVIDSLLIMGWLAGWIGISMVIRARNAPMGTIALMLGLIGPLLDLAENGMVWMLLESPQGVSTPVGWYLAWQLIRHLSYLISYAAAVVVAMGLWSRKPLDRVMCGIGTAGVVLAITGIYVPAMALISDLWWPAWFACGSLLLWRRASECAADDDRS